MQKLRQALPDVLIAAGVAAISYGAGIMHPAAGWIAGGVLVLALGIINARRVSA